MEYHLITIISFIFRMLELYLELSILSTLLNKKIKHLKFIFILFLYTLIIGGLRVIVPYSISWLIHPICLTLLFKVLFEVKLIKAFSLTLILTTLISILDVGIVALFVFIFKLPSFDAITENNTLYYSASVLMLTILFIIFWFIKYSKKSKTFNTDVSKNKLSILINALAVFIFILPNIFIIILYFDRKTLPVWIIFLNIFSILFIMVLNIINTNRSVKQAIEEERAIYQQNYITTLENLVDGLRTFKHDYSNTLATINGYIQLEKWDALKVFFEQILDESKAISTLDKLNPNLIKNPTIFGLITAKYQKCLKHNVKMNFEILGSLENLDIDEFDFTRILGIFLDNAIEAASSTKVRKINLLISESKLKTTIELSNSYPKKCLSNIDIFEKGVSSKGENRGLGLYKVKQILSKYPNITLKTDISEKLFLQKLIIPKEIK